MTKVKSGTNSVGIVISISIVICLLLGIFIIQNSPTKRLDSDCVEWGVEVEYPNGTKAWANTSYDPKNREEAERIAKQMELEDVMGNRYYTAKCRRYK